MLICQFCKRTPAAQVEVRTVTGFVVYWRSKTWSGKLCRECGIARTREALAHNAIFGWLGFPALVFNVIALVKNSAASRTVRRLDPPSGAATGASGVGALHPGLPALLRPRFVVPAAVVGLAAFLVWYLPSEIAPDDVAAGMCFEMPGAKASHLDQVDCTDEHDGQIAFVDPMGRLAPLLASINSPNGTKPAASERTICHDKVGEFLGTRPHPTLELAIFHVIQTTAVNPNGIAEPLLICAITAPGGTHFTKSYAPAGTAHTTK